MKRLVDHLEPAVERLIDHLVPVIERYVDILSEILRILGDPKEWEELVHVFNLLFRPFLELPCLEFDSIDAFAISALDCVCAPLQRYATAEAEQGNLRGGPFVYEKPRGPSDVPAAAVACLDVIAALHDPITTEAIHDNHRGKDPTVPPPPPWIVGPFGQQQQQHQQQQQ